MTDTIKTYSRARTAKTKITEQLSAIGMDPQEGQDYDVRQTEDGRYMPVAYLPDEATYQSQVIALAHGGFRVEERGKADVQAEEPASEPQAEEPQAEDQPESDGLEGLENAAQEAEQTAQEQAGVMLATVDGNLGIVPKSRAKLLARQEANKLDKTISGRDPISDAVIFTVEPHGGQDAKTAQVIAAAKREEGVTAAELRDLTGWTKAPWRWLFTNPKGTGWADKYGLDFASVMEKDANNRRQARYFLRTPDQQQGQAA